MRALQQTVFGREKRRKNYDHLKAQRLKNV